MALLLLSGGTSLAQTWHDSVVTRGLVWINPPRKHHTRIIGLGLGMRERSIRNPEKRLEVDGVNLTVQPLHVLFLPLVFGDYFSQASFMFKPLTAPTSYYGHGVRPVDSMVFQDAVPDIAMVTLNGVAIGTGLGADSTFVNGVAAGLFLGGSIRVNGLAFGAFLSGAADVHGLSVSVLNKSRHVLGLQVGVFNACRDGKVLQIGLLNRIEKRVTPLVNFRFRKRETRNDLP